MTTTLKGMNEILQKGAVLAIAMSLVVPAHAGARRQAKPRRAVSAVQSQALVKDGLESLESKEFTAAINSFTKAAAAKGDCGTYFLLGYAYYQRGFITGDPDKADKQDALEAVNAFTTALALDPELSQLTQPYKLYHSLAMSYEALGSYEKAVDAYKNAFKAAPHNPMMPLYAARLRYRMNDMKKSAQNLELALSLAKKEGKAKALVDLVEGDGKFSMMLTSDAHLSALRKYDPKAQGASAPTAEEAPARPAASPAAFANAGYGIATAGYGIATAAPARRSKISDAAPAAAKASSKNEVAGMPDVDAVQMRDTVHDSVKGTTPADEAMAPASELRRQDRDVLDTLSGANDDFKFRNYRQAITAYEEALSLNQGSGILNPTQVAYVHEKIGTAYNKLGQASEAIRALRKCVQIAPMNAQAHYQLSLAYAVNGRYQESVHALAESLRSAPTTGELKRLMLLAKTDSELEAVRDLPAFKAVLDDNRARAGLASAR